MEMVSIQTIEGVPCYLTFSLPSFLIGTLYERCVNSTEWLRNFRINMICDFKKPLA